MTNNANSICHYKKAENKFFSFFIWHLTPLFANWCKRLACSVLHSNKQINKIPNGSLVPRDDR